MHDGRKQRIPGLEMAAVTAEQLDEAGMLYTDEQFLLKGPEGGDMGLSGLDETGHRDKKAPSQSEWRKRASSVAMQAAVGLSCSTANPDMCKVRLILWPLSFSCC